MAETYGILAQSTPTGTSSTDIYTVPTGRYAVISAVVVCNQTAVAKTFRLSVAKAGATLGTTQYLAYDTQVDANGTVTFQLGITLAETDKIRAYISATTVSFNVFGVEIT